MCLKSCEVVATRFELFSEGEPFKLLIYSSFPGIPPDDLDDIPSKLSWIERYTDALMNAHSRECHKLQK
jgi:hypothetical protein